MIHASVGNINVDLIFFVEGMPKEDESVEAKESYVGLGGAATNYAIGIRRLGFPSKLVAYVGKDAKSLGVIEALEKEGVDTSLIKVDNERQTGIVVVIVNRQKGSRTMIYARNANELLEVEENIEADHVHFSSVRPSIVKRIGKGTISYDPGGLSCLKPVDVLEALKKVDWAFFNEREARCLGYKNLDSMLGKTMSFFVIKMGSEGAMVITKKIKITAKYLGEVKVRDPTGAGDAFDASFNALFKEDGRLEKALTLAVTAGALKVERIGGSNMPYKQEILAKSKFTELRKEMEAKSSR
ncbi:MAG: carbohydrate kinase family protein [Caldisphaeraceae archaeon]|nr:carbohydrate kinase family protein [Caldisphaeraceae archaeon]MEB3691522.1 carbohydrate kinase family protein [Caldisphaeraceae archaeon]